MFLVAMACFGDCRGDVHAENIPLYLIDGSGTNVPQMALSAPHIAYPANLTPDDFPVLTLSDPLSVVSEAARLGRTNAYRLAEFLALYDPALGTNVSAPDYDLWRTIFESASNVVFMERYDIGDYVQIVYGIQPTLISSNELEMYITNIVADICTNRRAACEQAVRDEILDSYNQYTNGTFWSSLLKATNGSYFLEFLKIDEQMTPLTMCMNAQTLGLGGIRDSAYTYTLPIPALDGGTNPTS